MDTLSIEDMIAGASGPAKPADMVSSFDVTTWVAFKAVFRLLQQRGLILDSDFGPLADLAAKEAETFSKAGEVQRVSAAQIAEDWFRHGATDASAKSSDETPA